MTHSLCLFGTALQAGVLRVSLHETKSRVRRHTQPLPERQYLVSRQGTCRSQSPVQTRSEGTSTPLYSSFFVIVQKNVQHDLHPFEHGETETK